MWKGRSKGAAVAPPEGKVRRSQVLMGAGPGSLYDLLDHAVMIGGLDFWEDKARRMRPLPEPRLRAALAARFLRAGWQLADDDAAFREAPECDDSQPGKGQGIPALEFPRWFVCQACRALLTSKGLELHRGEYRHQCGRSKAGKAVAVRFVAACPRGHVEDFPWVSFAHRTVDAVCASPELELDEGASGDFSEIVVRCRNCPAQNRLSTAMAPEARSDCRGERPWLGVEGREKEGCPLKLRLLVRTASNSYFAQVVSALSVPDPGHELEDAVRKVIGDLKRATRDNLPVLRGALDSLRPLARWSDDEILRAVEAIKDGGDVTREPLRTAELRQFLAQPGERPGEVAPEDAEFFVRRGADRRPRGIASVHLAHKLREVRVQIGFTRLEAMTPDLEGEYSLEGIQLAPLGLTTSWLPATEVKGEGVLLQLDPAMVAAWEERDAVRARERELRAGYDAWCGELPDPRVAPEFPGARFYLLHSLAHLLISAISLECGYAASAIRERIYCAAADADYPMAAILLSTGTTGSEGTLGGLVEQGRRIAAHLAQAWDMGVLCSNDPVCAYHSPHGDHAHRHLEGAACHGCLFIAECSCERFNRYLDRALVVPTIGHEGLAFFAERPA